ncbi:MAG TPA: hypothetical protein VEI83_10990 [Acidimicrobiales bacterium]|nr:hypothetical protein [Acidimicrobiales bacterium]
MAVTQGKEGGTARLMDSIEEAGTASLEALRRFADTVDSVFPHLGADEGPRRKIIDSAFKMTEQLVSTSTQLAQKILEVTETEIGGSDKRTTQSTK